MISCHSIQNVSGDDQTTINKVAEGRAKPINKLTPVAIPMDYLEIRNGAQSFLIRGQTLQLMPLLGQSSCYKDNLRKALNGGVVEVDLTRSGEENDASGSLS